MGKKRGDSGLCFLVGVDKPTGMSSHDVVNRCRRAFGERRIGHTGTLDPLASGVLPICVGAAARLDRYMTGHGKTYEVDIRFGEGTSTDDAAGEVIKTGKPSSRLFDKDVAREYLASIIGPQKQLPPVYSAIKVHGEKAYEAARSGRVINLEPRDVSIYEADLLSISETDDTFAPVWTVRFAVSGGTYIRSLARDAGIALGCPAHVSALRRVRCGSVRLSDCMQLEALGSLSLDDLPLLDPVKVLGFRFVFCGDEVARKLQNGNAVCADGLEVFDYSSLVSATDCACTSGVVRSDDPLRENEPVCMIADNRLKAVYRFDGQKRQLKPECVFQVGVSRG